MAVKFAFCLFKYFPFGGLQRDFLRIAKECMRRGHQIDVYTLRWEGNHEPGLTVHTMQTRGFQNHIQIKHYVKQLKPHLAAYDLVVGFNKMPGLDIYYAADTCYQAKARSKHGWIYRLTPRYRQSVAYEKAIFGSNTVPILLLSEKQQADFVHFYHTQDHFFHLLPPGIAPDRILSHEWLPIREQTRQTWKIPEDAFLLLFIGSGFKTKGLDRALQSIAALPHSIKKRTLLYVIGQDNPSFFLREAARLGIEKSVQFLGGRDDVPSFLMSADLLLHPAYNENTGTILLEAMTAGLPVLTTDVCGYAHHIQTANAGMVLPSPFQQTELNQALSNMLQSERAHFKKNALAYTKHADIYSLPEHASDIIESIANEKQLSPFSASFEKMMALVGELYREQKGRRTQRVQFNNQFYFIKQHTGVGWKEIFKNLFQWRLPIISAKNEWLALTRLKQLGILVPEVVRYEKKGMHPAFMQSYVLTKELPSHISLEDFCKHWSQCSPSVALKRLLIKKVASIARTMHNNGINHRDFYICHFLLDVSSLLQSEIKLYLIDLHRAESRTRVPERWLIKDLSGLFFSSKDIGLTKRDILRFVIEYRNQSLRIIVNKERTFWNKVKKRGEKLYKKHQSIEQSHMENSLPSG